MTSKAYQAANAAFDAAFAKFEQIRNKYRARQIGHAEYIAARQEFNKAQDAFDAAWTAEVANV